MRFKDGDGAGQVLPGQSSPPAAVSLCQLHNVGREGRGRCERMNRRGKSCAIWKSGPENLKPKEVADCVQIPEQGTESPFGLFSGPGKKS